MERSRRATIRIGHLFSTTRNKQKLAEMVQPYDKKFVDKQYIKSL